MPQLLHVNCSRQLSFAHRIPAQSHETILEYVDGSVRRDIVQQSKIVVGADASLTYILVSIGTKRLDKALTIMLSGHASRADIRGIIVGSGAQSVQLKSLTLHRVPNTHARITIDAVLTDQAEMDYDGMIKIVKQGQKTNSYLASHALLLSEDCRANAIPALEIEAHDVKCSHEVTVAPLDERQLFYIMSRGLDRSAAQALIIDGFIRPTLEKIPDVQLRKKFERIIAEKLNKKSEAQSTKS